VIHVVDTHPLIWHLEHWRGLGRNATAILDFSTDELIVPTIVLAEARYTIARKQRAVTWEELLAAVLSDSRFRIHDLDVEIVRDLPDALEMHDAIICATALAYQSASGEPVPVITRDREIRNSGLVQTVW
jgi:predicted nucleic acid-binding protein